ncbi:hypothetical protein ACP70R_029456 [Stipagrostis hirtigluma subsp. patula]
MEVEMEKVAEEAIHQEEAGRKRDRGNRGEVVAACAAAAVPRKKRYPTAEEFESMKQQLLAEMRRQAEEEEAEERAKYPDEDWSDVLAVEAREYRQFWESCWTGVFGTFETITPIQPMRYTDQPVPIYATTHLPTLQIFTVKIRETRRGLQWPLHVYGLVAVRDTIDHNRNIIFNRQRENCQTLTQEDPYLLLTGPTRAVVVCDSVYFEVVLKVKGSIESEDKDLSFLGVPLTDTQDGYDTRLINRDYTSKLSTLELTFGYVVRSVEATIKVQVTDGSWLGGFRGRVAAHTSSLEHNEVLLLDSGDEKMPIDVDGTINLSRCVASVEFDGELKVSVVVFGIDRDEIKVVRAFRPKMAGTSIDKFEVDFCKMKVTVSWSYLSLHRGNYS